MDDGLSVFNQLAFRFPTMEDREAKFKLTEAFVKGTPFSPFLFTFRGRCAKLNDGEGSGCWIN